MLSINLQAPFVCCQEVIPIMQKHNWGRIINISVPDWVYRNPHVYLFELRCKVGYIVPNITHHPLRAGLTICSGKINKDARQLAKEVVDSVKIETKIDT